VASSNPLNTINVGGVVQKLSDYEAAQNQAKAKDKKNDALGKDAFLQLLVTQMKYQDPLDPQDNSEYLSQLAQFSALEQMTNVSKGLENVSKIVDNINSSVLIGQLSNMIGQPVQWNTVVKGEDGKPGSNGKDGQAGVPDKGVGRLFSGTGAPKKEIGQDGDFYIDILHKRLYGPKEGGNWGDNFISLIPPEIRSSDYEIGYDAEIKKESLRKWFLKTIKKLDMNSVEELRNVKGISQEIFKECRNLESIIIGENVESLAPMVFSGLNNLKEIILNEKLEVIRGSAFASTGIVSITIPKNVKEIYPNAFDDCQDLKTIILQGKNPPKIMIKGKGRNSLDDIFKNCPNLKNIYIPNDSRLEYLGDDRWAEYDDYIKPISEKPKD